MSKIIAMVGISGSGKTKWAREYVSKNKNSVIVSRDKLRELLFGYTDLTVSEHYKEPGFKKRESLVTKIQDQMIKKFIAQGNDIVVDNTHLKQAYLDQLGEYGVSVETQIIEADVELCIQSDARRTRTVGEEIIRRQEKQFYSLIRVLKNVETVDYTIDQDPSKYPAYIFDIDGTLAHKGDRNPFDWKRVGEDTVDESVRTQLQVLKDAGANIIICTGRDGSCTQATMESLSENDIAYHEFYIRPKGSFEPDWKVKEAMWRDIVKDYYIKAMFDDRNQVVNHARKCGFKVYQVEEGDF